MSTNYDKEKFDLFMPITVLSGSNYENNLYKLSGDGAIIETTLRAGHINGFSIG